MFALNAVFFQAVWIDVVDGQPAVAKLSSFSAGGVAGTLLLGIPMGFLIYQLYYHRYKAVGRSVIGIWFYRLDRGAELIRKYIDCGGSRELLVNLLPSANEEALVWSESDELKLKPRKGWRWDIPFWSVLNQHVEDGEIDHKRLDRPPYRCDRCRTSYEKRFVYNWTLVQTMLDFSVTLNKDSQSKPEFTSGSDLYHALGASRSGVLLAFAMSTSYNLLAHIVPVTADFHPFKQAFWHDVLWLLIVAGVAFLEVRVLNSARGNTHANFRDRVAMSLAWMSRHVDPKSILDRSISEINEDES